MQRLNSLLVFEINLDLSLGSFVRSSLLLRIVGLEEEQMESELFEIQNLLRLLSKKFMELRQIRGEVIFDEGIVDDGRGVG